MNPFREQAFNPEYICKHPVCKHLKNSSKLKDASCIHDWNHLNQCNVCGATCVRDSAGKIIIYDAKVL